MNDTWLPEGILKQTLRDVEREEAEAISLLVSLLDKVRETSNTKPLKKVCAVVKEWQNQPPRGIVASLKGIAERLECQAHDNR